MRKRICIVLAALMLLSAILTGCAAAKPTRIVHCDRCGKECVIPADSNMTEDWILYCTDCEKELGLDKLIPAE